MRQLTSLDAQFLALETPRIYGHVSGVLILDPSTAPGGVLSLADLQRLIIERLPLIPVFHRRLAEVPFGLDYAYWVDDLPGAGKVGAAGRALQALVRRDGIVTGRTLPTPPRTSFNGRVSAHRRIAFGQIPLDTVKDVKNMHGATVNDVVVSICAGAVRRWLLKHRELGTDPLIAQIPVSVRSPEQQGTFGNRILLMGVQLHTEIADPIDRLRATHDSLAEMKERHQALPATLLQDANHFIPPALFTRAAQVTFAWASNPHLRPTWNLVISNVPGPQLPIYCAGARLEAIYPVSVITDGMGLNITVMSYNGNLNFGIVADRDVIPDLGKMMHWLEDELEALSMPGATQAPARAPGPPRRRRPRAVAPRRV